MNTEQEKVFPCETCGWRRRAEEQPRSLLARLWRWHSKWCPGWKTYQKHLAQQVERASSQY